MGTVVVGGSARALVVATGGRTVFARLALALGEESVLDTSDAETTELGCISLSAARSATTLTAFILMDFFVFDAEGEGEGAGVECTLELWVCELVDVGVGVANSVLVNVEFDKPSLMLSCRSFAS